MVEHSVEIRGELDGDGIDSINHRVAFNSRTHNQCPALLLANQIVYVAFGSHTDMLPAHGWIFSFRAGDLKPKKIWCSTPDGALGSLWMSGAGLIETPQHRIVAATGNGDFDGRNHGESIVALDPALRLQASFTPDEAGPDNAADHDFGSAGFLRFQNLLIGGGKSGRIFGVTADELGLRFSIQATAGPLFSAPVLWNRTDAHPLLFAWSNYDVLKSFTIGAIARIDQSIRATIAPAKTGTIFSTVFHGPVIALSANGSDPATANGWANVPLAGAFGHNSGTLRAFDANTLDLLWSEHPLNSTDPATLSPIAKFVPPVISGGRVYRVGMAAIEMFGLP